MRLTEGCRAAHTARSASCYSVEERTVPVRIAGSLALHRDPLRVDFRAAYTRVPNGAQS
jgi:hypothetical protein